MTDAPEAQETADEVARAVERVTADMAMASPSPMVVVAQEDLRTILSRLAVLEEERRLDGEALDLAARRFEVLREGEPHVPSRVAFGTWAAEARARLQARKGEGA